MSSIIREGKRQRFCQQCGRFHDLTSFDGDKRSCRARLQRHNARRRKKTTDSDAPSAGKALPVKRQSSLPRNSREYLRSESSKKQQTSDSASVSQGLPPRQDMSLLHMTLWSEQWKTLLA